MQIRGSFANYDDLYMITNPEVDDVVNVGENTLYRYNGEIWEQIDTAGNSFNIDMNEYQLNQMVIKQLPDYKNLYKGKKIIREFTHKKGQVFMLLCHELRDYTILYLEKNGYDKIEDVVIECLQNRGTIKDISKTNDAVECWITIDDEPHMFLLFNYDGGFERCV